MAISDLILNGDFENGTLSSWVGINATVTSTSHSGLFAAQLQNAEAPSVIYQIINGKFDHAVELLASVSKTGQLSNPPIAIVLTYFGIDFTFLGTGLVLSIPEGSFEDDSWQRLYKTSTPAPAETTFAVLSITKSVLSDSAEILVDDVSLITTN